MKKLVIFIEDGHVARVESDSREIESWEVGVVDNGRPDMLRNVRYEAAIAEHVERSRAASQIQGLMWAVDECAEALRRITMTAFGTPEEVLDAVAAVRKTADQYYEQAMRLELMTTEENEQKAAARFGRDWAVEPEADDDALPRRLTARG
jgi:hypothetical protein